MRRGTRVGCGLVAAVAVTAAGGVVAGPAAAAGAGVTVSPATADPEYASRLSLRGTGFQSVPNGFGGVYVLFGAAEGAWRPSQGGRSGVDYVYVQDSEAADNLGYQRFVAFPGDPTAAAANGGTVAADGSWAAELVVPGAVFQVAGRDGAVRTVDCRVSTCGVITIGAHGVVNPTNETFTPISFAVPAAAPPATSAAPPTVAAPAVPTAVAPTAPATGAPAGTPAVTAAPPTSAPVATSAAPSEVASRGVAATTEVGDAARAWPWVAVGGAVVALALGVALFIRHRRSTGRTVA